MFDIRDDDVLAILKLLKRELLEIAEPSVIDELREILTTLDKMDLKISEPLIEQILRETPTLRKVIAENIYPKVKEIIKERRK